MQALGGYMKLLFTFIFFVPIMAYTNQDLTAVTEQWRQQCVQDPAVDSDTQLDNCIARFRREYERVRAEEESRPNSSTAAQTVEAEPPRTCGMNEVRTQCQGLLDKAQQVMAQPLDPLDEVGSGQARTRAIVACQAGCDPEAAWVVNKIEGCGNLTRRSFATTLAALKRSCNRPGETSGSASVDEGGLEELQNREVTGSGLLVQPVSAVNPALQQYFAGNNAVYTHTASSFHNSANYRLNGGVIGVETTDRTGATSISFRDAQGNTYSTYNEALASNNPSVVMTSPRPIARPENVSSEIDQQAPGGAGQNHQGAPPQASAAVNSGTGNGGTTAGAATSGATSAGAPQPQAVAATRDVQGGNGFTGVQSTGSSNFNNPFGNSSIDLTGGGSSSGGAYVGTGGGDSQNGPSFASEGVGGGGSEAGGGSSGSSSGGGSNGSPSRRGTSASSDAGATGRASTAPGVAPMSLARSGGPQSSGTGSDDRADTRVATLGTLESAQFQSGFHKAPEQDALGRPITPQEQERRRRARRQRISNECRGDMQCIARILGRTRVARPGRGVASVNELPECVWRGYGDILNHMAQVHDRISIDHEGGLEGLAATGTNCSK